MQTVVNISGVSSYSKNMSNEEVMFLAKEYYTVRTFIFATILLTLVAIKKKKQKNFYTGKDW